VEKHKGEAEAKSVHLRVELPLAEERVLADHERIVHVFSNLIANALRYTPPEGTVMLGASLINGVVRFTVADNGRGIATEYQERVFEKFFQVPDAEPKGTGLGLYISREIVRGHGGDIGVESEPDQGSVFWFTLPGIK
jgi:signal transduction histidine kinase